jgi:hypothetical protein
VNKIWPKFAAPDECPAQGLFQVATCVVQDTILSLGALHLTLMAVLGIWIWSAPVSFERNNSEFFDFLAIACTSMSLLGHDIHLTSLELQRWSLAIYSLFLIPWFNLLFPALICHAMHSTAYRYIHPFKYSKVTTAIFAGSIFLLATNIVFIVDTETTIFRARTVLQLSNGSQWTFGQILGLLLLSLQVRAVLVYRKTSTNERLLRTNGSR